MGPMDLQDDEWCDEGKGNCEGLSKGKDQGKDQGKDRACEGSSRLLRSL